MIKALSALFLSAVIALPCVAAQTEARLKVHDDSFSIARLEGMNETTGYSIAPLEGASETTPFQAVKMSLPVTEAFAPNVNVQIQPYPGTIEEFAALSRQQFTESGLTVLIDKATKTTVVWEYTGMLPGRQLRWYAKAKRANGKVYLVTATAIDSQWDSVSSKLKACVDSFKIEDGERPHESDK